MPRFARVVVAGAPQHVTPRGNRRAEIFFTPEDRDVYRAWLREYAAKFQSTGGQKAETAEGEGNA